MSTMPVTDDKRTAIRSMHLMASGDLADLEAVYTVDAVNREAKDEPPDARGVGPAALYATARWLRSAFSELAWEIHDVVQDDDLVVVHATMSGRQTGPFVAYGPDGAVTAVFPPRVVASQPFRPTGSACETARWPSTGPTATT
jgi:ketosteroid isomerase-like protein